MPTTLSGITYTPEYGTTTDGGACRWYMDDTRHGDLDVPLMVFVHGSGGTVESFGNTRWDTVRDYLIDQGWAVVEGDAGGTTNWGNQTSRDAYLEMVAWVERKIDVGQLAVIGQSMGGINSSWLASMSPLAGRVIALVVQNGVTDLVGRYEAAPEGIETRIYNAAYGVNDGKDAKDVAAFTAAAGPHSPMTFPLSAWAGQHVLHVWSLADTTVPPTTNGMAWVTKYGPSTALTSTHENAAGGHYVVPADSAAIVAFMTEVTAPDVPEPPARGVVYLVQSMSVVGADGKLYPATPA